MRAALQRILVDSWTRRGGLALLLWPLSVVYGLLVRLRKLLYQRGVWQVGKVPVPVVMVGNLVAGGGGKTPTVMALVQHLQRRRLKVGVVSRGYGRLARDCREVTANSLARDVGDEPLLIREATGAPVFVAEARIDAARALLLAHPEVNLLVCDDGLQHYGMHRDIEVCVFDERGLGNGLLLPAGPLREPWPRATDLVLAANGHRDGLGFSVQRSLAGHARRADGSTVTLDELRNFGGPPYGPLWAVAGIARPEAFFAMLRSCGLTLEHTFALADHASFEGAEWSRGNAPTLICTEKDAVKLWHRRPDALAVPLVLHVEAAFWDAFGLLLTTRVGAKLSSPHGHTPS